MKHLSFSENSHTIFVHEKKNEFYQCMLSETDKAAVFWIYLPRDLGVVRSVFPGWGSSKCINNQPWNCEDTKKKPPIETLELQDYINQFRTIKGAKLWSNMDFQNPSKRPEIWLQESLCHPVLKVTTSGQIAAVSGRFSLHPPKRQFWRARNQKNHHSALRSRNLRPLRKSWHGSAVVAWTRNPGPSQICAPTMLKQIAIWFLLHLTCKFHQAEWISSWDDFLHLSVRRAGISCGVQGAASSHLSSKLSHKGNQEVERILKVSCRKRRIAILGHSAKKDR